MEHIDYLVLDDLVLASVVLDRMKGLAVVRSYLEAHILGWIQMGHHMVPVRGLLVSGSLIQMLVVHRLVLVVKDHVLVAFVSVGLVDLVFVGLGQIQVLVVLDRIQVLVVLVRNRAFVILVLWVLVPLYLV